MPEKPRPNHKRHKKPEGLTKKENAAHKELEPTGSGAEHPNIGTNSRPIFFFHAETAPYGVFCQWYLLPFIVAKAASFAYLLRPDGSNSEALNGMPLPVTFNCAEQYMMYCKAIYFNDAVIASLVMQTKNPRSHKQLGRQVSGFDGEIWSVIKSKVVEEGNFAKFSGNEKARKVLLGTGGKLLCEASPFDRVWGIGFRESDAVKMVPQNVHRWGTNLLGKALMVVRERLREDADGTEAEEEEVEDFGENSNDEENE